MARGDQSGPAPIGPADEAAGPIAGLAYLRLIALGAAIGIPAALVAVGFIALVHELEHLLWVGLPDALGRDSPPWYLIAGLPVAGAAIVAAARALLPGDGGHRPIDGISAAPTPARYAPGVTLAALGSLPFGAVLGPEAPLIALGSALGMLVAPLVRLPAREKAVLGTAGSFAAIAALFGGPVVAGIFLVEAGIAIGAALIPLLLPGLVAAAIGYLIFTGLGDWSGLREQVLTVPDLPAYDGTSIPDLLLGLAVGVLAALLMLAVRRIAVAVAGLEARAGMPVLVIAGGLALGVLALGAEALGADPVDVLFSGQASVPTIIAETSAAVVAVVLVAKALAYSISLGCGFRGGPVFPAIMLGVSLAALAIVVLDASPTLAVAIGTAAGMTAATRLIFSSLVFALIVVGSAGHDTMPAAALAAVAAWVTVSALDRRSKDAAAISSASG